jgi:hypothetical protein
MLLKNFYHVVFFEAKGQSVKFAREREILLFKSVPLKKQFFSIKFPLEPTVTLGFIVRIEL